MSRVLARPAAACPERSLEGKVAVVTGAAGTMGLAATRVLLSDGCKVAMVDANRKANEAQARKLGVAALPTEATNFLDPGEETSS